ncbi:MAG: DUF4349 domain-containing protein, partial [Chloroflexota bacterium]|nr:DUF4349 domain-containing protein [Chloroflexota bacterium]
MDQLIRRRRGSRRMVGALAAAALVVLIAACGAGAGGAPINRDIAGQPGAAAASGAAEGASTGSGDKGALAALADQKIIKTGEITVEVPNVASALAA